MSTTTISAAGARPAIVVNDHYLQDTLAEVLDALITSNMPPHTFVRGGHLVRVRLDEQGNAKIEQLGVNEMRVLLIQHMDFHREYFSKRVATYAPVAPPMEVLHGMLSLAGWPGIPPLIGLTTAPLIAPDGTVETTPGYLPKSRRYYASIGALNLGSIHATQTTMQAAISLLRDELLGDFPFADEASQAHALALIIEPFVRPYIDGPTPFYLITAPKEGTGKGLLATATSAIFVPGGAAVMTLSDESDEVRKSITTALKDGSSHILLDNLTRLDSRPLAAALTGRSWTDRLLGTNTQVQLPIACTWFGTGNNITLGRDFPRRIVAIRLDANIEQPTARQQFRHPNLLTWVGDHRAELIIAVLTLLQAWSDAGRPERGHLGGFERWASVLGGILDVAGVSGFLLHTTTDYLMAPEEAAWDDFIAAWYNFHQTDIVSVAQLFELASTPDDVTKRAGQDILADLLGSGNERSRRICLGKLLGSRVGQVYGNHKLTNPGRKQGAALYQLTPV